MNIKGNRRKTAEDADGTEHAVMVPEEALPPTWRTMSSRKRSQWLREYSDRVRAGRRS